MSNIFKFNSDNYVLNRGTVLGRYLESTVAFIKRHYPELSEKEISDKIKAIAANRIRDPLVMANTHPVVGKTVQKKMKLSQYIQNILADNIFSVSGSTYYRSSVRKSFLSTTINNKRLERDVYKKALHHYTQTGDTINALLADGKQNATKITMNSASGAMGSIYAVLYDNEGFNAVTSISRHCVKYGYSHTERLLEGNLFITSVSDSIQYCITLIHKLPTNIQDIINKYNLYIPSHDELTDYINTSLGMYTTGNHRNLLHRHISVFTDSERCFIFYAYNLKNLFSFNSNFFKNYIQELFVDESKLHVPEEEPPEVKYDGDLTTMVKATYAHTLGNKKLHKTILSYVNSHILKIVDLLQCFLRIDVDLPNLNDAASMIRKCVPVSDTDSVIFTTATAVEWYVGKMDFGPKATQINMFVVYLLSRTLEHVFARQSTLLGAEGDDRFFISMKNEFYYTVLIMAQVKKHYAAIRAIREGNILPTPEDDIKGLGFKSSNLSNYVINKSLQFIHDVMVDITENNNFDSSKIIKVVSDFEYEIYLDIKENKTANFYGIQSVKPATQYDNPDTSIYRNYLFWEKVFGEKYGHINIPTKCYVVPLEEDELLKTEGYLAWLKEYDKNIYKKLTEYMSVDNKKLTRVIFPMTVKLPVELHPVISIRSIISNNCSPLYLLHRCLGVPYEYKKKTGGQKILVSDYFRSEEFKHIEIPLVNNINIL